jgi:hypothetical protein
MEGGEESMPRRRTARQDDQTKTVNDEKNRNRLRKLMAALGVPENASEVSFHRDDNAVAVSWK